VEEYLAHCYATRSAARVSELAFRLGVERSQLTRAFLRVFGVSPLELMRDLQVRRARELLIASRDTNEEIALSTGFGTRNTFQRVFRALCGVSPSEYRRSHCTK